MRLIDADALKAKLKIGTSTATYSDYCNGYCDARQVDLDAIDAAPTIEAEPVRHGRWNYRHEDDWCYCTACGTDAEGSDGECLETDYCPHCGARMDGGADD